MDIDAALVAEAKRIGKHRTKREAVNAALAEYIAYRRRLEFLKLRGTIDFIDDWDRTRAAARQDRRQGRR